MSGQGRVVERLNDNKAVHVAPPFLLEVAPERYAEDKYRVAIDEVCVYGPRRYRRSRITE